MVIAEYKISLRATKYMTEEQMEELSEKLYNLWLAADIETFVTVKLRSEGIINLEIEVTD